MQRAAYILPNLAACYIGKGQSRCQHHWSVQPRALLTFFPSQLQVWYFQLFQRNVFPIPLHSACLPPPTVRGVTFRQTSLNGRVKKRTGIISILVERYCMDWVTCWQLPGSLLSKPKACRFGADSQVITLDKNGTRLFCRIHSSLQSPRYYRSMSRWGKVSWNNSLEGIQLKEETLCTKICLVTGKAMWTVQVLSNRSRFYHTNVRSVYPEAGWSGLDFCQCWLSSSPAQLYTSDVKNAFLVMQDKQP